MAVIVMKDGKQHLVKEEQGARLKAYLSKLEGPKKIVVAGNTLISTQISSVLTNKEFAKQSSKAESYKAQIRENLKRWRLGEKWSSIDPI